ncbi:RHS repeat-associated core domain-containing protein [Moritella marina ATCC 15381]|uniref:RHS repeat-associated core domain-containing protein n=1 Tax=Moritella marina ATCC 15381 TaxID=1202962 RepID=A0A5J6WN29_MORMI|nr:RHS repeat-associated core domain-containing protein [Moritella marina]QFI38558.1 RHS repeat-associated core domain-containing protein [Moritella marina ATCC 15381]
MKDNRKLYRPKAPFHQHVNASRRQFIKRSSALVAAYPLASLTPVMAAASQAAQPNAASSRLAENSMGFNGERKDPVTGLYHLGNGYRVYNPRLMRFHAMDSMSPFGKGGINSYAYCLGDPVNLRDPSGHFAIMSLIIGAVIGAVIGASVSAAVEGIRAATTGTSFDWKQVGIGAALGFLSGGFGAAAVGAKTGVQVGLAVADAVVSGAADFGINVAAGASPKDAAINAGIGAVIGLATFGVGKGVGKVLGQRTINNAMKSANRAKGTLIARSKSFASLANESYFLSNAGSVTIRAHGDTGIVGLKEGLLSGRELSDVISKNGYDHYPRINLEVCHSADGGTLWSIGQELSNRTGKIVKGFKGEVNMSVFRDLHSPRSSVFTPQSRPRQRITSLLNRIAVNDSREYYYHRHPNWR